MKKLFILLFTTVIIGLSSSAQSILYEGFENALLPPTGWVATSDCDYSYWYGWLLSQTAHTGNNSAYIPFAPFSYTHDSYLITPQLAITGHKILSFWHAADFPDFSSETSFTVEISTTGTNPEDFTVIHNVTINSADFTNVELDLASYTGQNIYIAFHIMDEYGTSILLDDIDVYELPDCTPPTDLAVSDYDFHAVTLTWTPNPSAESYSIEYIPYGGSWDNAMLNSTLSNSITLINLQSVSVYQARISSNCGGTMSNIWSQPITFSTLCEMITLTQDSVWNENFESVVGNDAVALNSCWETPQKSSIYNSPYVYCGLAQASHSGVNSLEMRGNYNETNLVVLPAFSNDLTTLKMSFFANTTAATAQYAGTLEVGYITDPEDATTFVVLETLTPNPECLNRQSSTPYGPFYFIDADPNARMAIRFKSNAFSTSWNFDDFNVSPLAECVEPIFLQALNITDGSADLTWIDKDGYLYDVLIWQSGSQDTVTYHNVSLENGPFHVDSLLSSTAYSWIVRTICSDSSYSYAVTRGHFNTPNATLSLPYICDFEDTSHDYSEEFAFSGTGPAQWYIGTATSAPSTNGASYRSLYISEDQGLSNSYNTQSNSYAYATFDVNFPNEAMEYHLEFDLRVTGECNWDEFSVHLLDGGASIPSSGAPGGITLLPPTCDINSWSHYTLTIPDAVGAAKKIVFYWHNDNYVFGNPPAAIDNISINGNACARPTHLTVSNIDEDEVTVSWQENATATSWTIYYKSNNSDTYEQVSVYGSPIYTLDNLIPNTGYVCFVKADCDNGELSNPSNPISFRTLCSSDGIATLPYFEDFETYESVDGSDYVPCWSRLSSNASRYVYVNYMDFETSCLDFNYTPNCYTIAVLPMFNSSIPLNTIQLNMDVRRHNLSTSALEVGAMTDPADASTFVVIDTVSLSSTYEWINKTVYCSEYAGDAQYLAFRVQKAGYYTVAIDNLLIDYLPMCIPPSQIVTTNTTATSAEISWNGNADFFRVYLVNNTDTTTYDVSGNSLTINNLTPSSTYCVMVQAYCDNDTSAISDIISFHTQCGSITISSDNPWSESFENYYGANDVIALSPCWSTPLISQFSSGTFPVVSHNAGHTHSGQNSLEIRGSQNMFVLPEFTNDLSTLQISLWGNTAANDITTAGTLLLGVVTDASNPNTFTTVANIPATAFERVGEDAPHTNFIGPYNFSSINWQPGMRIAFRYQNSNANNAWNLDDFVVTLIPNCTSPDKHSVTIDNVTEATATIHWQDNVSTHDTWCVFYKPVNAPNSAWQIDTAFSNQFLTLNGLASSTTYEVYVTSYCGSDESNPDATLTKQFTTTQVPTPLPYSTDFTQADEWILSNGDCENYWIIRNTTPTGNNHALFITHNGVIPGYNVTSSSIVAAEKLFTIGQSAQVQIDFDINVGGEMVESWDYDFMKLFFAPSSSIYEASSGEEPVWASQTYSTYAYNFSQYLTQTGSNLGTPYNFSMTQGNVVHISAVMDNPNPSPNEFSVAKLVFAWINDYIDGTQPGAIITNLSIAPVACPQPTNLNITNIESTEADIYWIAGQEETSWILGYKEANASNWTNVTTTSNSYHLTSLLPNTTYDVRLQANCGSSTSVFLNTSFTTSNCGQSGSCGYSFLLSDAYGDGWNGASINVLQNGILVNNITLSGSYDELVNITLCDNTPTTLVWNYGQYDSECSFFFVGPDGATLFSISDLSTITNPTLFSFTTDCSTMLVCNAPTNLTASGITHNSANVSWNVDTAICVLQYKKTNTSTWSPDIYLLSNHYSFTGLEMNTSYDVRVKEECLVDNWSTWSDVLTFSTLGDSISVIEPTVVTNSASDITTNSAQLNGTIANAGNQTIIARGFEWKVTGSSTYTQVNSSNSGTTFNATLTGLTANTSYTYRAFATTANATSYGDEVTFTTNEQFICEVPTGLDTVNVANQHIVIHWTDNANASQWNVQYCTPNAPWTTENAYATTHTIAGLEGNTTYQIRVRANCGADGYSDWSSILEVTTKNVGINEYLLNSIKLYPNPANDVVNVECTMNNVQVGALEVFDVYGKLINTVNDIDNPTRLNVSGLASGMYFVRVTTEQGVVTKSFVKR